MTRAPGRFVRPALLLAGVTWFAACGERPEPTGPRVEAAAHGGSGGSGGSGLSISSASPGYGHRGDHGLVVTIAGSGFQPDAQASWKLDGNPTTDVTVLSTTYVSSTQLSATIDISTSAQLSLYDVAVTQTGRKGIGTESSTNPDLFEVTNAIIASGMQIVRRTNDAGEFAGSAASGDVGYFDASTAFAQEIGGVGTGYGISPMGNAIVGVLGDPQGPAYLWTRAGGVGSAWQATALPVDASSTAGAAKAILIDMTGQPTVIGGYEIDKLSKRTTIQRPVLWIWNAGAGQFDRVVLPTGSSTTPGEVVDLSDGGMAVGVAGGRAAVWNPDGSGGYALTVIGPDPSRANAVNPQGTTVVGWTGSGGSLTAAYWQWTGSGWTGAIAVPGCSGAKGVSEAGRIVLNTCNFGNRTTPAYMDPPYVQLVQLHGLGPQNTVGLVSDVSPSGQYVTGQASVGGVDQGIYWKLF